MANFRPFALEERCLGRVSPDRRAAHEEFSLCHFQQIGRVRHQADFDLLISGSDALFRLVPGSKPADFVRLTVAKSSPWYRGECRNRFSPSWTGGFKFIANAVGYRPVGLPTPEASYDSPVDERVATPFAPFEWMRRISDSFGYLGARYPPVIVALLAMVPVQSIDKYHFSWWDKRRSKNFDLMAEFGISQYCVGEPRKKYISPATAIKLLCEQEIGLDRRWREAE